MDNDDSYCSYANANMQPMSLSSMVLSRPKKL